MTGTLPTELGQLTLLNALGLENNAFNGTVPTEFSQLSELTMFSFEHNKLTGSVNNILCSSTKQWQSLESDCLATNNEIEIECQCCTVCCNVAGEDCQGQFWLFGVENVKPAPQAFVKVRGVALSKLGSEWRIRRHGELGRLTVKWCRPNTTRKERLITMAKVERQGNARWWFLMRAL